MQLLSSTAAIDLLVAGRPLLDVRSEGEYRSGTCPGAVNVPILNDAEREQVGICYKRWGQAQAISLGHSLVGGRKRSKRLALWLDFFATHPGSALYCWRGGLRSELAQSWLRAAGRDVPRLAAGYKGVRHALLHVPARVCAFFTPILIGGLTGSGKTRLLQCFPQRLDLEAIARHRGSTFGAWPGPQPTQIDFENTLAIALLRHKSVGRTVLLIEDEGRTIGSLRLPAPLYESMQSAPMVVLEAPFEERVEAIYQEYIVADYAAYKEHYCDRGQEVFTARLQAALARIRKRAGESRYRSLSGLLEQAVAEQRNAGRLDTYRGWIAQLLQAYYDPMYRYQMKKKESRILCRKPFAALADFLEARFSADTGSFAA